jgi:hypothetical protein
MNKNIGGRFLSYVVLSICVNTIIPVYILCQNANSASVTSRMVAVVFSLGDRSVTSIWEWNRLSTPDNICEYRLVATVVNDSCKYTFGFFLFKHPGARPQSGELYGLLKAGQFSLTQLMPDGKNRNIAGPRFTTECHGQRLTICFEDSASISRVFSSRPKTLTLEAEVAQLFTEKREVTIEYDR